MKRIYLRVRPKHFILLIFVLCLRYNSYSQQIKVLFIGNSLTYYSSTPYIFEHLAIAQNKEVFVDQITPGGYSLADHCINPGTLAKINSNDWDYIILQGSNYNIAFPEHHDLIKHYIVALNTQIHNNNPNTKVIFFLDWSMRNVRMYNTDYDYSTFQWMIMEGTRQMAYQLNMMIAPIGWAWKTVYLDRPDIDLYHPDGSHPSYYGAYLSASVYYSTIFHELLINCPYYVDIEPEIANYLQKTGTETVMDDLDLWNINITSVDDELSTDQGFSLDQNYPNPFSESTIINYKTGTAANINLSVYDSAGRRIAELVNSIQAPGNYSVEWGRRGDDGNVISSGVYYIVLSADEKRQVKKLICTREY
ncbi:T9SS type A sorting domain-containing protein [Bacteroidota bacterium]